MWILSHVLLFTSHRFHLHLYSSSFSTDHFSGTLTSSLSTQIPMQFMSDCRKDMVAWRLVPRVWGGLGSGLGLAIVFCSNGRHIPLTVLNFIFERDIYFFIPTSSPSPPHSPPSPSPPSPSPPSPSPLSPSPPPPPLPPTHSPHGKQPLTEDLLEFFWRKLVTFWTAYIQISKVG